MKETISANPILFKLEAIRGFFSWRKCNFDQYCKVLATYDEDWRYENDFYRETKHATTQIILHGTKENIETFIKWHMEHNEVYGTRLACICGVKRVFISHSKKIFEREILFQDWFLELFKSLYDYKEYAELEFIVKHKNTGDEIQVTIEQLYRIMRLHQQQLMDELHEKFKPGGSEYENIKTHFTETANEH